MEVQPNANPEVIVTSEKFGLKHFSEGELLEVIFRAGESWTNDERDMVMRANDLMQVIHADDRHRGGIPYSFHPLRNAARAVKYLHIYDSHTITGILLHDTVEDHPDEVIAYGYFGRTDASVDVTVPCNNALKQQLAFEQLDDMFSPRSSQLVAGLTKLPKIPGKVYSEKQKLDRYAAHVEQEIRDPAVFLGKLVDWVDNALGGMEGLSEEEIARWPHFETKYGLITPILEARFYCSDIQALLDPVAKANVEMVFAMAKNTLKIPAQYKRAGSVALQY